jgi:hypothetical protein
MSKTLWLVSAFILFSCLSGCNNSSPSGLDDRGKSGLVTDSLPDFHQIFYGTWEVHNFIPGGRYSDQEEMERFVGTIIEFSEYSISVNSASAVDVEYVCVLVNTDDRSLFWRYYYPDNPSDVLNLDSPYFAYIYFNNRLDLQLKDENEILNYMDGFYIKDSETLIFNSTKGLLKMTRIAYPEDYQNKIGGV